MLPDTQPRLAFRRMAPLAALCSTSYWLFHTSSLSDETVLQSSRPPAGVSQRASQTQCLSGSDPPSTLVVETRPPTCATIRVPASAREASGVVPLCYLSLPVVA